MLYAISLWEPWASLVAWGFKKVETRHWQTPFRKPLAIHAAKTREAIRDFGYVRGLFEEAGVGMPDFWPRKPQDYPLGKVVALTRLADCRVMTPDLIAAQTRAERAFGNWAPGRFAWPLPDARRIGDPVPVKGFQGFFKLDPDVEARVLVRSA